MYQQTESPPAAACSQGADTGPAAQATTRPEFTTATDSKAVLQFAIAPDEIVVTAILAMGAPRCIEQRWTRRTRSSFLLAAAPVLWAMEKDAIGHDLADFLDHAGVPLAIANMLPRPASTAASAAIAAAALEVANV
ncbi:hypothetical protein DFO63_1433 [Stenotrophomonas sp. AG209]|jgi:hypothetical protein|uniref:hypothetical protein n=1 Tax=Stenotrophomonas TaxID=40323 RepID=UPI000E5C317A|nr:MULTISPECIES: hypothetical protein [Stenotrophomonas]MBD3680491.1 hypothetical protein [Stenotrophomonas sp. Br8]RIA33532.1 hypothetical protein DFO63_1433 [Stenotrophomonas sp. AG209]